jgi:hypothetical protein
MVQAPVITLSAGLPSPVMLAQAIIFLFLPGYAVARLLLPAPSYGALDRFLAAPALTLALVAVLTLWATVLGIPLGPLTVELVMLLLAVAAVWPARRRPASSEAASTSSMRGPWWHAVWRVLDGRDGPSPHALVQEPWWPAVSRRLRGAGALDIGAYLALFALALALRLWSTRDVLPTLGADTYHHALIAQLIVEHGGLPAAYEPYAPITTFAYHFGFHTLLAWLHWWTRAGVGELLGQTGHLVNAAVALGVAFFVRRLFRDALAAGLAAWLVALLCIFPAYLVNWGRFTQAGGLLLLPVAAALWLDALRWSRTEHRAGRRLTPPRTTSRDATITIVGVGQELVPCRPAIADAPAPPAPGPRLPDSQSAPGRSLADRATGAPPEAAGDEPLPYREGPYATAASRVILAAGLTTAGLLLTHYRMLGALGLLLVIWLAATVAYGVVGRIRARDPNRSATASASPAPGGTRGSGWAHPILPLTAPALVAGLLVLPWLLRLPSTLALGLGERPGDYGADYYALDRLGTALGEPTTAPLLLLAAVGLALAAWTGRWAVLLLGAWASLLLALANPYWWPFPMPLAGRVDLVTVLVTLGFPVAVTAAYGLAWLLRAAHRRCPGPTTVAALVLGVAVTALGGWQLQTLVTPNNALVAPADLAAAGWLRANTAPDARLAVSATIFPWAPDYVVGVDAGYWLPLLGGRATTVLPMLYAGERGADPRAVRDMVAVARALREAPAAPETATLLRALGVGYVYHSGRVPVPEVAALAANPGLPLVYERDGVRVFAVAGP